MANYFRPSIEDRKLFIPEWCYEDTPVEYDYTIRDDDGYKFYVRLLDGNHPVPIDYDIYRDARRVSYFACNWYPKLVEKDIPTIPSELFRSSIYDIRSDLKDALKDSPEYKFIRLCGGSPKDVVEIPIFSNYSKASDAIMRSSRTLGIMKNYNHSHLFIRKVVDLKNECRCIVHKRKLRAVSVYLYVNEDERGRLEDSVLGFFNRYSNDLPYNSCVMELGWIKGEEDHPVVIEFNSFGIDGFAGSSLFDWDMETGLLYKNPKPEFRYYKEFEWC